MFKSIQVSGTSGSGKTTLVRHFLELSEAQPVKFNDKDKPLIYEGRLDGQPMFFLGHYQAVSGGCDTIPSVKIVAALLEELATETAQGLCLYEGLMISHMVGTVGAMQVKLGGRNHVRAFLDTPLETCLERVQERRDRAGNTKPFNPDNTISDYPRVLACRTNAEAAGIDTYTIDHKLPVAGLLNLIGRIRRNSNA